MRLISDYKDYYDSALSFGSDPNLNYLRKKEAYEFAAQPTEGQSCLPRHLEQALRIPLALVRQLPYSIQDRMKYTTRALEIPVTTKVIGFCGVLYAAIEIDGTTYYAIEQIVSHLSDEFLQQFGINQKSLETLLLAKSRNLHRSWTRYLGPRPLTYQFWERAVAEFSGNHFDEVFIEAEVPTFKVEHIAANKRGGSNKIRCTLNPYLRDDLFQKIKPPAEAFQEISMYLGNQLARQMDPPSAFSDEIMRDEKGFDEWSFRRHKEESKKYKK